MTYEFQQHLFAEQLFERHRRKVFVDHIVTRDENGYHIITPNIEYHGDSLDIFL